MEGSTRGRKGDVDALAATVLLQHALRSMELAAERALNAGPVSDARGEDTTDA